MTDRKRPQAEPREGICVRIDPDLANTIRQQAAARGVHQWWILEHAMLAGIPLLPPPGQETLFANSETGYAQLSVTGMSRRTRWRGRPQLSVFTTLKPGLIEMLAQEVAARDAHQWWVVENALRLGLPLLPEPEQGVMLRTA